MAQDRLNAQMDLERRIKSLEDKLDRLGTLETPTSSGSGGGVLGGGSVTVAAGTMLSVPVGGTAVVASGGTATYVASWGTVPQLRSTGLLYDPGSNRLALGGGTTRADLALRKAASGTIGPRIHLFNTSGNAGAGGAIDFDGFDAGAANDPAAQIRSFDDGASSSHLTFWTKPTGNAANVLAEAMRITSTRAVLIGKTSGFNNAGDLDIAGTARAASLMLTAPLAAAYGGNAGTATPAFSVDRNGSDQSGFSSASWVKVLWTREVFDSNANFASSTFTPTVAGKYLLSAAAVFLPTGLQDTERLIIGIWKNGAVHRYGNTNASGTDYQGAQVAAVVEANGSSDYFEIYFYHTGSNSLTLSGDTGSTFFSGTRVGP